MKCRMVRKRLLKVVCICVLLWFWTGGARGYTQANNRQATVNSTTAEIASLEREAGLYDHWAEESRKTAEGWRQDAATMRNIAKQHNNDKAALESAAEYERRAKELDAQAKDYERKAAAKRQEAQRLKSQLPAADLTGFWQDRDHGVTLHIVQSGYHVALDMGNGIVLTGTLTGSNLTLSYIWTPENIAKHVTYEMQKGALGAADKAAAIQALTGKAVHLAAVVGSNGDSIEGKVDANAKADAETRSGSGTTVSESSSTTGIRLSKKQAEPHCSSETAEKFPRERARTRLGVGEQVTVTVSQGASDESAVTWSVLGSGKLSATSGASVTFTAGERAGTTVVTAKPPSGSGCSIVFSVIEPDAMTQRRVKGTELHQQGTLVATYMAQVFALPDDVSFYRIYTREREACCEFKGSKTYAPFFEGKGHGPNPDFLPMKARDDSTEGLGTQMAGCDEVGIHITGPREDLLKVSGQSVLNIPQEYLVADSSQPPKVFTSELQKIEVADGAVSISKSGSEPFKINLDDPNATLSYQARMQICESFK
jgi:hypothetical protein